MENIRKRRVLMMVETVLEVVSMVVALLSTIVKIIDLVNRAKDKHQKSNRRSPK